MTPLRIVRYTRRARWLHWTMAALIALAYALVLSHEEFARGTPLRALVLQLHFWVGLAVLVLLFPRLRERLRHPPPPITPPLDRISWWLKTITHAALYAFFLVQPLLGLATVAWLLGRLPIPGFDVSIPLPVEVSKDFAHQLEHLHVLLGTAFYWVIGLHVAAALFHRFVRRDDTLQRMT